MIVGWKFVCVSFDVHRNVLQKYTVLFVLKLQPSRSQSTGSMQFLTSDDITCIALCEGKRLLTCIALCEGNRLLTCIALCEGKRLLTCYLYLQSVKTC